ncbi:hypothetical protein H0H81_005907 [Sphagnurus paluster]|uniref:Uncharacterized protein n=1 Tax=Sphagnurus paluster TaxID=117069 RepID=A0A9P7GVL8_9AGAR|nr:hypothetical protein H0H81_005907 [Sphagnurus paluster]
MFARSALTIDSVLKPLFAPGGKYAGKVKVIARLQVQPWHSSSTLTHESALALFKNQGDYFDIPASTLTPLQVRESLAQLAAQVIPANAVEEFKEVLKLKSSPNGGNGVTDDLKYTSQYLFTSLPVTSADIITVKFSRQNSIHVSPTVLWDGLVAGEISSSWGEKEWNEFLANKVNV